MSNLNLRVHIAPVGFEVDRIVIPAKRRKADRVWLMVHENRADDKAGPFVEKVRRQLQRANIEVATEHHDRLGLFKIIRSVRDIIEREKGNNVYVNLASGSKIQAIGGMMACMMFNSQKNVYPFYVEARDYLGFKGPISTGVKGISDIPPYDIQIPEERHIGALRTIMERGGRLTKKEMAELADREGLITVNAEKDNYSQARFASLDKNIIQPLLERWGFVRVDKVGRARWIEVTEEGRNAAEFLI